MRKLLLALATGAVGALVLHIVIILFVPYFAVNDAWSRISALTAPGRFVPVDALVSSPPREHGETAAAPAADAEERFARTVACRFEIGDRPIHLKANGTVPFWSLGVFDRRSNELFSINDRNAGSGAVDVALATPVQMIVLRESIPAVLAGAVLVEMPVVQGYVVLRTVIPDASFERVASDFLDSATCGELVES